MRGRKEGERGGRRGRIRIRSRRRRRRNNRTQTYKKAFLYSKQRLHKCGV
jgi:hypothetical protein